MAFCNSCGAQLTEGTKFCSKCGAAIAGVPAAALFSPTPGSTPAATAGSSSALKTILVIVGAIVLIGVVGIASLAFIGMRVARHTRVMQEGDHVKVETPFGTAETSKDPDQAAKDLGIDVYPGAEAQKEGSSTATFGRVRTVSAAFLSDDAVEKVCAFYRSKFPNATVSSSDRDRCTIVSNNPPNMITINVEPNGEGSKFQIASVSSKSNP
ncbi:MAG TPA: zinc-ribbon domain-containing protein [Candidatus Sulfotelmatobacter sp.]|nr:zinc-ribbon domain-containing protein [Candidatus Sulfotelmatobacter sp.]